MFSCLSNVVIVTSRDINDENIAKIIKTLKTLVNTFQLSNPKLFSTVSIWPVNNKDAPELLKVPSLKSVVIINLDTAELTTVIDQLLNKINEVINLKKAKQDSSIAKKYIKKRHKDRPMIVKKSRTPHNSRTLKTFSMHALTSDQRIIFERLQGTHPDCQMPINTKEPASLDLLRVIGEETCSYIKSLSSPRTTVKFLRLIDLISQVKIAGIGTIWHKIKHNVENRFDEFLISDPNKACSQLPRNCMLNQDRLPDLSIFQQPIQKSNGYKRYCSKIIHQSKILSPDILPKTAINR